ncbi:30S ribosomal protein S8 [Candidatus Curtissbacteria bacterium RIFCSPHIGHO2_02_FULL_40_17]|uniref:Small ribosomal subunit protein uS8 n=4 Tax=Candidatus Curtissiibacteriota TaxID=1752717 RepID=A0A1F5GJA4_9BACT|nr:MAG: 30S ribosomal protein S8 [Candidatus Curtissbacteria bacterium RIFCSPHIGHO2_01_FULL_40_12]OGD91960.1 MAG: 30S ribosomal protein S8 [Candidatus Curtissbacteria bacterium RIFCSPHIGHO2_02_FULL_40_17]OGE05210.1 MAG: 30S ribosomal protein S8 [Candidatus Curtissbacteria bacterium RIFCSPHIGHO2_12_FULL_41_17]OGE08148.1 MAG: 30S ribosomal protein S8 [Candidatus Curtissbacteria bacterium RIFCSPLOWO2_02_FULL_40_13b]
MDPVSDMLVAIKNGYMAKKSSVAVPFSKFKQEIAKLLERENIVGKTTKENSHIMIELQYENQKPKITQIERISKLGLRVYKKSKNIKRVKGGKGISIVSTSKGLMTGDQAKAKKLGGEIICRIW